MCVMASLVNLLSSQGLGETKGTGDLSEHRIVQLIYQLTDEDAAKKSEAIAALRRLAEAEKHGHIIRPDLMKQIASNIKGIVPFLIRALKDQHPYVRNLAVLLLRGIGPDAGEAIPQLAQTLKDPALINRNAAAWALAEVDPRAFLQYYITPALREGDADNLNDVAELLDLLTGNFPPLPFAGKQCPPVFVEALEDEIPDVRVAAAWTLTQIGSDKHTPPLMRALKDSNPEVRGYAALALGKIRADTPEVVPVLIQMLEESKTYLRCQAAEALGKKGDSEAVPHLIKALKEKDWTLRDRAIEALADLLMANEECISFFIKGLKGPNPDVRMCVARVLGRASSREALPHLTSALEDKEWQVRSSAIWALGRIGLPEAVPPLEKALKDENPYVAKFAALALGEIAASTKADSKSKSSRWLEIEQRHRNSKMREYAILVGKGRHVEACSVAEEILSFDEYVKGPEHPTVANDLNNLATDYTSLGDYAKAEPLYKRSLAIREKALGPDHPDVAATLNNLAKLYQELGDYASAVPLCIRSVDIWMKALGPDHLDVATSLNNLAFLWKSLGGYAEADPLYKRSLAISEKALGPDHSDVAVILNNLGDLYEDSGEYGEAEPLHKRALAIWEAALGPDHPNVATSLNNLAGICSSLGDYGKAEPLYKRALAIKEKSLGPDHPDVAISLNSLATLYAGQGEFRKAHSLHVRAQEIDEKIIDQVMGFTSEDRQAMFLSTREANLEMSLSLVAMHLREDPSARKNALDIWLRRKGVLLEAQRRFQEAMVYSDDPEAVATFQELARVRSQLSQLTFGGPGKDGPEAYQKKIVELENRKRDLEARLSTFSKTYALKKKIERADSTRVAQTLPVKTALLEFVRIDTFNVKAKGKEKKWLPARYLAFVLHAGKGDRVEMIDLGDAGEIDRTVARFKKELGDTADKEALQAMETSRKIHDLVFQPLKKALGEVKEVFISPDGNLNLIPFEVLRGPDGKFLIEDYTFNYLAAGRDIIGFGEIKEKGRKALLIGDPDFDLEPEDKESTLRKLALSEGIPQGLTKRSSEMGGFNFTRLPGTKEEVEGIRTLLGKDKADLYTGGQALEEVLRQKGTPSILHLATHGFFLNDLDLSGLRDESDARGIVLQTAPPPRPAKGVKIENPLLRSGIALAGANNALKAGELEKSDGIVTAEKILGLRLRGTDMVVLSACETGLGEVKSGEGVYGLRRAFIQAGTRGLVMSMWSVPDRETKELMVEFYRNVMSEKMNRCQALRQAALKQMQVVKDRYGHPNPFYWGAFVFLGEP
ncbi:MAG: tetratricopeptide repeat protein [Thermodesulfobacteriota bacterium]